MMLPGWRRHGAGGGCYLQIPDYRAGSACLEQGDELRPKQTQDPRANRVRTARGGCAGGLVGFLRPLPAAPSARGCAGQEFQEPLTPPRGRRWPGPGGRRAQAQAAWQASPGAGLPSHAAPSGSLRAVSKDHRRAVRHTWPKDQGRRSTRRTRTSKWPPPTGGRLILNIDE